MLGCAEWDGMERNKGGEVGNDGRRRRGRWGVIDMGMWGGIGGVCVCDFWRAGGVVAV